MAPQQQQQEKKQQLRKNKRTKKRKNRRSEAVATCTFVVRRSRPVVFVCDVGVIAVVAVVVVAVVSKPNILLCIKSFTYYT